MISISKTNRSLINIIGVPVIILSIYFVNIFPIMISILIYFCSTEYVSLVNRLDGKINKWFLLLFNFSALLNSFFSILDFISLLSIFFVLIFLNEIIFSEVPNPINCSYYFIGAFWIGYSASVCLYGVRNLEYGMSFTFIFFISIWICDTFAYILGSKLGKRKILERISPNKTYVGSFFGLIGSLIAIISFYYYSSYYINMNIKDILFLTLILGGISQIGDFSESLYKRRASIKDTSNILMGHGGFLDRFDSILFAAPLFYLYIKFMII